MQTELCLDTACRQARVPDYYVIWVKDAHCTFGGDSLSAARTVDQFNETLGRLVSVRDLSSVTI